jgi:hypothetical protein
MAMGTSVFRIRINVDFPPVLKFDHTCMGACRAASPSRQVAFHFSAEIGAGPGGSRSAPGIAHSTTWRTGEDETKNRQVIVMPIHLR